MIAMSWQVGEPQGPERQEHFRWRVPGAGQHRSLRQIKASANRRYFHGLISGLIAHFENECLESSTLCMASIFNVW